MTKAETARMIALIDDRYLEQALQPPRPRIKAAVAGLSAAVCLTVIFAALLPIWTHGSAAKTRPENEYPAVYIEKAERFDLQNAAQADMIGFMEYQDRSYFQTRFYYGSEMRRMQDLIGQKIGTADSSIVWHCVESHMEYHASHLPDAILANFSAEVHTVKGYDPTFRLCAIFQYDDGSRSICFYECLNGISYRSGSDIYDLRLHMPDNVESIASVSDEDGSWSTLDLSPEWIGQFVSDLCVAQAMEPLDCLTQEEYHFGGKTIGFAMKDGVQNTVRLYEGGYADYLGCFVKLNRSDAFSTLYAML